MLRFIYMLCVYMEKTPINLYTSIALLSTSSIAWREIGNIVCSTHRFKVDVTAFTISSTYVRVFKPVNYSKLKKCHAVAVVKDSLSNDLGNLF